MRGFLSFVFSRLFLCFLLIAAQIAAIIFLCLFIPSLISFTAAVTGIYLLSAVTAIVLVSRDTAPEFKCAWLALIAAIPLLGAVIYLITCYRGKRMSRTLVFEGEAYPPQADYDDMIYFEDGTSYFNTLFNVIDGAKKYIYLEYYIISGGEIFEKLLKKLKAASLRGVEIKILTDGLGSVLRLPKRKLDELKRAGAQVKIFHKIFPIPVSRLNMRDHRKIAVIDGRAAFTGGINIADEYANLTSPHGYWKDTGIAVFGNAVKIYEEMFLSVFEGSRTATLDAGDGGNKLIPVYDCPPDSRGMYEDTLSHLIERAERRIYAFTPYLCLNERIKRALVSAARRGADVKIIIPSIPDKRLTYEITLTYAEELERCGVQIYLYTPGFMHAKSVILDDCAVIGSYNLDFRSMCLNYECAALFEGGIMENIVEDFNRCLAVSRRMKVKKANILKRALRSVLKLFAPLV